MNYTLLYVIVILILVLTINSMIAPKAYEHFAQADEEVPLKGINLCGRNIVFPYFSRNRFTASQRALMDNDLNKTNPVGKCRIDVVNGVVNHSHSIVHENSLFYTLKYTCLGFRIASFDVRDKGKLVYITFKTETDADIANIVNLILLNSLYVEFSLSIDHSSFAYRIANDTKNAWIFSNHQGIKSYGKNGYTLPFVSVSDNTKGSCDKSFNYSELSPHQSFIKASDLQNIVNNGQSVINLKAYHLDTLKNSFQYIGRSISPIFNSNGTIVVFEKDYQKYYNKDDATQLYEFMNNIALMYSNNVYPVFTYNFSIDVNRNNLSGGKKMIMKVYMNNNIGKYSTCSNVADQVGGGKNNNIVGVVVERLDDLFYKIYFFTGSEEQCFIDGNNTLSFKLPFLTTNNQTNICLTVTPNEKIALANWNDINMGDLNTKIVFGKKNTCNTNVSYDICIDNKENSEVKNSLYDLFMRNMTGSRTSLENIYMNYNTNYVKDVKSLELGHVNLINKYFK